MYAGKHLWCSFGYHQPSGVGRDGGSDHHHTCHLVFSPLKYCSKSTSRLRLLLALNQAGWTLSSTRNMPWKRWLIIIIFVRKSTFCSPNIFWPQYFAGPAGALRYHPLQGCQGQACPQGGSRWIERRDGWRIFHYHWKVVGRKRRYAALHNLFFVIIPPMQLWSKVTLKMEKQ